MILLTRLNGDQFALNVDLIERAETTPDTVIRMVDGSKYVVSESLEEVITKVADFKALVLHAAASPDLAAQARLTPVAGMAPHLRIVPDLPGPPNLNADGPDAGPSPRGNGDRR